jgi:hypothetical protein
VAAAAQPSAARQIGQVLSGTSRRQVAVFIGKADDAVGVADVDPGRVWTGGVKGDAEGLVQAVGEDRNLRSLAVRTHAAEDLDLAGLALGQKQIAIGRGANQPRVIQASRIQLHLEACGRDGQHTGGPGNDLRPIVHGLLRSRRGQVGHCEVAADAGGLVSRVGESSLAGKNGVLVLRAGRPFANLHGQEGKCAKKVNSPR